MEHGAWREKVKEVKKVKEVSGVPEVTKV